MTWRARAAPLIARVLFETRGKSPKEIKAALTKAYPFGARECFPYKVWLDEIRVQMGTKVKKPKLDAEGKPVPPMATPLLDI